MEIGSFKDYINYNLSCPLSQSIVLPDAEKISEMLLRLEGSQDLPLQITEVNTVLSSIKESEALFEEILNSDESYLTEEYLYSLRICYESLPPVKLSELTILRSLTDSKRSSSQNEEWRLLLFSYFENLVLRGNGTIFKALVVDFNYSKEDITQLIDVNSIVLSEKYALSKSSIDFAFNSLCLIGVMISDSESDDDYRAVYDIIIKAFTYFPTFYCHILVYFLFKIAGLLNTTKVKEYKDGALYSYYVKDDQSSSVNEIIFAMLNQQFDLGFLSLFSLIFNCDISVDCGDRKFRIETMVSLLSAKTILAYNFDTNSQTLQVCYNENDISQLIAKVKQPSELLKQENESKSVLISNQVDSQLKVQSEPQQEMTEIKKNADIEFSEGVCLVCETQIKEKQLNITNCCHNCIENQFKSEVLTRYLNFITIAQSLYSAEDSDNIIFKFKSSKPQ